MKKFTTIQSWLATKPSQEEQNKVLNVINRGETSRLRKDLYETEAYMRKLKRSTFFLNRANFKMPKELEEAITATQVRLDELRAQVPVIKVNRKKAVEVRVVEDAVAEEVGSQEAATA